jgi:signal transduction histidine kinase
MKLLFQLLLRQQLYERIPSDDLMSRQRFTLFRILSYTGFAVSIITAIQISTSFEEASLTATLMYMLSAVILINFYVVNDLTKLPISYAIALVGTFLVIHIQAYTAGGILNTGTVYMCVIIMTSFMFFGPKGGLKFTIAAILNIVYFYFISEYTTWTNYALFKEDSHLIHLDALTTFIFGLFLVAAQSNYLNSGKNVIIQRIIAQKDQLILNNKKLQEYSESLEKSNKELDKFASIVSHDLKAPLRAIGNLTGWIEEDSGDELSKEARTHFDMIKQRVTRMEDLINAILDYSRADRRRGEDESIDLNKMVTEVLDFIGKPDNVTMEIKNMLPVIVGDRTRMSQIFSNLIGNAIKYNDKEQIRITVSATESKDGYTISIQDNGPGIDPQFHERIFVIFQTLNRRDDVESTGVGLAIVKKIIEEFGGKIWVDSELRKGANFQFFLPKTQKSNGQMVIAATVIV